MTHRRTLARILVLASILAGSLVAASSPAHADFHLMKVQEVYAGSGTDPSADFVELRMDSAGQNRVGGHVLYLFGAPDVYGGSPRHECTIPANAPNAALDDRILFATSQFTATAPDFTIPPSSTAPEGPSASRTSTASAGARSADRPPIRPAPRFREGSPRDSPSTELATRTTAPRISAPVPRPRRPTAAGTWER